MAVNSNEIKSTCLRLSSVMDTYSTRNSVVKLGIDVLKQLIEFKAKGVKCAFFTPADIYVSPEGNFLLPSVSHRTPEKTDKFSHLAQLYTAPEAYDGIYGDGPSLFSLGTIMYKLLNGGMEPLRTGMDFESASVAYKRRMSGLRVSAPQNADALLSAIIIKACEYDSHKRYSDAEDMLDELMLLADGNYQRKAPDKIQKEDEIKSEKKVKKLPLIFGGAGTALVVLLIAFFIINFRCNGIYVRADRYIRDGKIEKAQELLSNIRWYKDSQELIWKCDIEGAQILLAGGKTDKAIELLKELKDEGCSDAEESLNLALIKKADELMAEGKNAEAEKIISKISGNKDATAKDAVKKHKFNEATALYDEGKFEEASRIFEAIGEDDMVKECDYACALEYKSVGDYVPAMGLFASLDNYSDSESEFNDCEKLLIEENTEKTVLKSFKNMVGTYSDEDGYYVEYSMDEDVIEARYSLPFEKGAYFRFKDGVHYHSSDSESWKKQWIWEATSDGEFLVYDYIDKKVYSLTKES